VVGESGAILLKKNFDPVVSVESPPQPASFVLYPNYPNPFNISTIINYELKEMAAVRLEVYNLLGQHVRSLVGSTQPAGFYRVEWNGHNDAGDIVPTGLYFCRLQTGRNELAKTIKMVLLK
jgi:hypothetical protein